MRAALGLLLLVGCADLRPIEPAPERCGVVHPCGVLDPGSSDFHGQTVRQLGWDLSTCATCHGDDFAGGRSGVTCLNCHQDGPSSCTTCHGQPPATGAHQAHAGKGPLGKSFACAECHLTPTLVTDVGHVRLAEGVADPPPAEVQLLALAAATPTGSHVTRHAPPSWDAAARTCSDVYCHGAVFDDSKATRTQPRWNTPGDATCGSCHGAPPSSHAASRCSSCHPTDPARHVDGVVQIGDGSGGCNACHGTAASPAPPRDLDGKMDGPAVGAHQAHLGAAHRLRGPLACTDCHQVPASLDAPGHIDSEPPAEVFPMPIAGVSLAFTDGASPAWDHAAGKCANVYCHGGGAKLAGDQAPNLVRSPSWSGGTDQAACGRCHGVPPVDGHHTSGMTLASCATCHPATVDAQGAILVDGQGKSKHIDGVIDAQ